jgi:polyhydroxybutyrate depolymerase
MLRKLLILFFYIPYFCIAQQQIAKTMFYNGDSREYIVYIPSGCTSSFDCPLLFSFHGGNGYASDFIQINDMRPIADTANFIAVYPQGAFDYGAVDDSSDASTSWIHKAPTNHDDIFFIEAIIDSLSAQYSIDINRIYACGYSEGAIFSYELGCRLNSKIAAFAAVSGSMLSDYYRTDIYGWNACSPTHPTAMMLIPGTNDENPHSNYNGFSYLDLPLYFSVNEITAFWSNHNNTDLVVNTTIIDDSSPNDGSTVESKIWSNGDRCTSIQELKVIGGDHDWPGTFGNMDINASAEVWSFLSKYNIDGLIACDLSNISNYNIQNSKILINVIDVIGRKTLSNKNHLLFYIYDDGTVEKRIILD